MVTITSIDARFVHTQVGQATQKVGESVENLASGIKRNANVADLSVGTGLKTRVSTLRTTLINAGQGQNLLNTAKGALEVIGDILQKQKSLAVKSADDSLTSNERAFLDQEFQANTAEIDRIADNTSFNGKKLLDGSISGSASLASATGESSENYSLISTSEYVVSTNSTITGTVLDTSTPVTFANDIDSANSGTKASIDLVFSSDNEFEAGDTLTIGATTITFGTEVTQQGSLKGTIQDIANYMNNLTTGSEAEYSYTVDTTTNLGDTLRLTYNDVGVVSAGSDDITIGSDFSTTGTNQTLNIGNAGATNASQTEATAIPDHGTDGTAATSITTANTDYTADLQGAITEISAQIVEGSAISDTSFNANTLQFTAVINGEAYTSRAIELLDGDIDTNASGTGDSGNGLSGFGNRLNNGTVITFVKNDQTTDSTTTRDVTFQLTIGSTDQTVDTQAEAATLATTIQSFLDDNNVTVNQSRDVELATVSTTNFDIASAAGTVLDGIQGFDTTSGSQAKGDIVFRSDAFGDTGTHGSIGSFDFNRDTNKITVDIGGVTYTADLSDSGGYSGTYASNVITTDGTIIFTTADTTDGRQLRVDLNANVTAATIEVNTADREEAFENALNSLFGVSENDSLSFQVGVDSTDAIGISLSSSKTDEIYKDNNGITQALDVTTLSNAQAASDVIANAINTNISQIADILAKDSSLDSAIKNNEAGIQNADAARSRLLDTDYTQESTDFAEARVKQDVNNAILSQVNARIQNLLQLVQQ